MRSRPCDTYASLAAYIFCSHWLRPGKVESTPSKTAFTSVARSIESILLTNDSTRANSSVGAALAPGLAGTLELLTSPSTGEAGTEAEGMSSLVMVFVAGVLPFSFCNFLARSPSEGESWLCPGRQKNKIITDADKKLILRSILSSNGCGLPCRQTKRTAHSVHTRPRNGRKLWAESTAMAKGITRDRMALWNLFYGSVFSWRNYL